MTTQKYKVPLSDNQDFDYYSLANFREATVFLESTVRYRDVWSDAGQGVRRRALISSTRLHNDLKFLGKATKANTCFPREGIKFLKNDEVPMRVANSICLVAGELLLDDNLERDGLQRVVFRDLPAGVEDIKYEIVLGQVAILLQPYLNTDYYNIEHLPAFMAPLEQPNHPDYAEDLAFDAKQKVSWLGRRIRDVFGKKDGGEDNGN